LANWLLYVAADEVEFLPRKWEENKTKAAKEKAAKTEKLSIAKTRRSSEKLFLTFDKTPFLPQSSNKGKGNIKEARPQYKVVKKDTKKEKAA